MPLLTTLALGAGILGGTQYLMKKADEKENESLLNDFVGQASQTPFGQQYAGEIAQQAATPTGFFDAGQADRTRSLLNNYRQAEMQVAQDQAANQMAQIQQGNTYQRQLEDDYSGALARYNGVQNAYRKLENSVGEDANTADKLAGLYNFFSIIDPGRAVQGNEAALFNEIGGITAQGQNWVRSLFGKGLNELTREEIMDAAYRQFQPEYQAAQRQRTYYDQRWQDLSNQGYNVRKPRPYGIDWQRALIPPGWEEVK